MPKNPPTDATTHGTSDLISTLEDPYPASPFSLNNDHMQILNILAQIFNTAGHVPTSVTPPPPLPATTTSPRIPKWKNHSKESQ